MTLWLVTAVTLSDSGYCNFISDGFQAHAKACYMLSCVLDAEIFSTYNNDGWTEEQYY